jgi:hypothetical protein
MAQFCREYQVSDKIRGRLEADGFETAKALFNVSENDLMADGYKRGHIAELKRALKEFVFKHTALGAMD